MEFLKEILGEELFKQFETAVTAYNGSEANKDKQIKLANLGGGEYVGKGKYDALQAELEKTKLENAIQLALRDAKAVDPEYLAFKLREKYKPEELTLDENGKVKGMDDKLAGLKTQFPNQFESAGQKKVKENKLPEGYHGGGEAEPKSLEDALKLAYEPKNE